jgi:acyl-CoA reductase-like NAD-dependent aldehyde dehydrogenase
MELGGKDAFIVCDDADLEQAVHAAMTGCYVNCGQNCVASERILVHERVYEEFERRVTALVSELRQGNGRRELVDVGAIITPLQLDVIDDAVQRAVAQGARLVAGGKRSLTDQGDFFEPTILADVTPDMDIAQEEVFGPVMLLMRFGDDAQAIDLANGVSYGLSSSVFSRDRRRARKIAEALETGMTAINEFGGITYMAQDLTFGGVKASGYGRMNGREGLRSMCNIKAVIDDRIPVHRANEMYPVRPLLYPRLGGVIELIYGRGLRRRLRGLMKLLQRKP